MRFTLNGTAVDVGAHPMARLLDVLRVDLGLTGTKEGCGEGECGACTVLIDRAAGLLMSDSRRAGRRNLGRQHRGAR
jgi:aerobic-type carbon monoxide dehydrogenase small subunit (CoxS/CutS family)